MATTHTNITSAAEASPSEPGSLLISLTPLPAEAFETTLANLALALLKFADKANAHADSIDYDLSGAASIDLPFLRNLPFRQSGTFKLPLGQ